MSDRGLEPEKPVHEERRALARTVGGLAALAAVALFLLLSLLVTVWLDRRGLAAVGVLAAAPVFFLAYRVFSRWERAWEWIASLADWFPPLA